MYGKPFDHKAHAPEVHGDGRFAFEQNGQLYNAMKQPVDSDGKLMPLPPRRGEDDPPVSTSQPTPTDTDPDEDEVDDDRPFNILAWAQGDETLKSTPWPKVKAEALTLLGDASQLTGKSAARKAILQHYNLPSPD